VAKDIQQALSSDREGSGGGGKRRADATDSEDRKTPGDKMGGGKDRNKEFRLKVTKRNKDGGYCAIGRAKKKNQ